MESLKNMESFNWKQYISNYQDLQAAGINTQKKAIRHFNNYGKSEGRTDTFLQTGLPDSFDEYLKGPSLIISLKRIKHIRGDHTLSLLKGAGFENCKLTDAVDASVDDIYTIISEKKIKYTNLHNFSPSQKGCGLSHLNLWEKIVKENLNYLTIFEDDALPEPNFKQIAKTWYDLTPKNIDICYLGSISWEFEHSHIWGKHITHNSTFCTHAYIITNNGAKKALELYKQSCEKEGVDNIDSEIKKWCDEGKINWCVWNIRGVFNSALPSWNVNYDSLHGDRTNGLIYQNGRFPTTL